MVIFLLVIFLMVISFGHIFVGHLVRKNLKTKTETWLTWLTWPTTMIEVHQISWSKVTRDQLRWHQWHPIPKTSKKHIVSFLVTSGMFLLTSFRSRHSSDLLCVACKWLSWIPKSLVVVENMIKSTIFPHIWQQRSLQFPTRKRCFLTNEFLNWDLSDNPKKLIIFFYHHPTDPLSICIVEERSINHRSSTQITMLLCC